MGIENNYRYKDPTALMAIENIMKENRRKEHVKEITKKAYEKWSKSQSVKKKKFKTDYGNRGIGQNTTWISES